MNCFGSIPSWGDKFYEATTPSKISGRLSVCWTCGVLDRRSSGWQNRSRKPARNVMQLLTVRGFASTEPRLTLFREKCKTEVGLLDRRILPQYVKRGVNSLKDDVKFVHGVTTKVRALVQDEIRDWKPIVPQRKPKSRSKHKVNDGRL